ncbi:MAG: hypothetical protein GYB50_03760 [Rhodobacteraceae bacterium]|nr:hypothetical protein [Paracoccaceae bacterium]
MGKVKVAAFVVGAAATKSGISISLAETKSGQFIRIGLSESAQKKFFGGALNPQTDALEIILDNEPRNVHLMGLKLSDVSDADAIGITPGIRGSISLKVLPWRKVAAGKRPATSLTVVNQQAGKLVSVRLPEWAQPEPLKIGQGRSIMD